MQSGINTGNKDLLSHISELEAEIEKLKKRKKYGLVWEDKPEQVVEDCKENLPVLEEVVDRAVEKSENDITNLLIEGDNYHALSVLNYTHAGKIDVIYVDPPYNTGAKDWKYNNDYVDINDSYRHSKWLSMMYSRLLLAKNLLKDNGVLICTIDKNEQANLGVLLQELFSDQEIVCVTIVHNHGGIQGKNFSHTNEYAYFIHPRNGNYISTIARDDTPQTSFRDWGKENSKRESAKTCFYPIFLSGDSIMGFGDVCADSFHPKSANIRRKDGIVEVYPIDQKGIERKWRFGRETVEDIKDELVCKRIKEEYSILREKRDYRWKTVWTETKYNANVYGTKLLNNIIDTKFPYPKSLYAVMDCIKAVIHSNQNAIILDFFAGSGTTGHAVLELNKEDGGNRQFILCTNNENSIAEEVTYPRVKNVIEGYADVAGIPANLRYFKTSFVQKSNVSDDTRRDLIKTSTEMICVKEGTFAKVSDNKRFKIYKDNNHVTGILFDLDSIAEFKEKINHAGLVSNLYVFSLTNDTFDDDFADLDVDHALCAIPESILEVYRKLFV